MEEQKKKKIWRNSRIETRHWVILKFTVDNCGTWVEFNMFWIDHVCRKVNMNILRLLDWNEYMWLKDSSSNLNVGDSIINELVKILCDEMGKVALTKIQRCTSTQRIYSLHFENLLNLRFDLKCCQNTRCIENLLNVRFDLIVCQ